MTRTTRHITEIIVGSRTRKEMGNLTDLINSIDEHGLLHPITIDPDDNLIAGHRRLEACRLLGWDEAPVMVVETADDALKAMQIEQDENTCRKDFTPTEAVEMGRRIEEIQKPKAAKRTGGRPPKNTGGNLPQVSENGKTRDKAAEAAGMSPRNYDKAKAVVVAAEAGDPVAVEAAEEMDKTGKVDPAYRKVRNLDVDTTHKPNVTEPNGNALQHGHDAIACLKKILPNDRLRNRGFEVVLGWIADNGPDDIRKRLVWGSGDDEDANVPRQ